MAFTTDHQTPRATDGAAARLRHRASGVAVRGSVGVRKLISTWRILLRFVMSERRELYRSPNGDSWYLGREPQTGDAFVIHQPNGPSGGKLSYIEIGEFLRSGNGPEQQALKRLISSLVETSPLTNTADLVEIAQGLPTPKDGDGHTSRMLTARPLTGGG